MFEYLPILASVVSVVAAFYTILMYRRKRQKLMSAEMRLFSRMHELSHLTADLIQTQEPDYPDERRIYSALRGYLDVIRQTAESIASGDIDCSIKVIESDSDEKEKRLFTLVRDSSSMNSREVSRLHYPVTENLPYRDVILMNSPYSISHVSSPEEGGFVTTEPNRWREQYKSVVAVPIHSKRSDAPDEVIGVLTIESTEIDDLPESILDFAKATSDTIGYLIGFVAPKQAIITEGDNKTLGAKT